MTSPAEKAMFPPVPTSEPELIIEALRFANRVSGLLNDLSANIMSRIESDDDTWFDDLLDMLRRRFSDCSGLHLFIAANNLSLTLPDDLQGEPDSGEGDD